ncbi:hypothetical protein [Nostoc sp.]|uniref:hypothetical protein n=1 Tax=Nostoc sp. TaxID=1180 RepID=UPI002FFB9B2C
MLGTIFERFVEASPVSVMMPGLMERVFAPEQINRIFEENAKIQYTRELLFSSLMELMKFGRVRNPPIGERSVSSKSPTIERQSHCGLRQTKRRRVLRECSNSKRDRHTNGKPNRVCWGKITTTVAWL